MDIIKRASLICEKLIVGVAHNIAKKTSFTVEERLAMIKAATHHLGHVEVVAFAGLAIKYASERRAHFLVRGLRSFADFDHESQMATANRGMNGTETVFFMAQHAHISSTLIREIAHFGGPLKDLVPEEVEPFLRKKFTPHK